MSVTKHGRAEHAPDYTAVEQQLTTRFAGRRTAEEVRRAVAAARAELEPPSRISAFLEVLVERRARAILDTNGA